VSSSKKNSNYHFIFFWSQLTALATRLTYWKSRLILLAYFFIISTDDFITPADDFTSRLKDFIFLIYSCTQLFTSTFYCFFQQMAQHKFKYHYIQCVILCFTGHTVPLHTVYPLPWQFLKANIILCHLMLYETPCTLTYSVSIAMTVSKGKYHTLSSYALRDTLYPYIQCIPLPYQFMEANIILSRLMLHGTPCTLTYSVSHCHVSL